MDYIRVHAVSLSATKADALRVFSVLLGAVTTIDEANSFTRAVCLISNPSVEIGRYAVTMFSDDELSALNLRLVTGLADDPFIAVLPESQRAAFCAQIVAGRALGIVPPLDETFRANVVAGNHLFARCNVNPSTGAEVLDTTPYILATNLQGLEAGQAMSTEIFLAAFGCQLLVEDID